MLEPHRSSIQARAEQLLVDRIFMGDYQEKRYDDKIKAYKDLVVLNRHEKILCDDLVKVKHELLSDNRNAWFGFTTPDEIGAPAVYCVWTSLEDKIQALNQNAAAVVFGEYWFQIKAITFAANSMEICVKVLRPVDPTSSMSSGPSISTLAQQALEINSSQIQQYVQQNIVEVNWMELFQQWKVSLNQKAYQFFSQEITWANFVHCIRMLIILSIALAKFSVNAVHYLGEFTLKFVTHMTKLVHTASPIVLAVVNLLAKMIGGLYILLAMVWRDMFYGDTNRHPQPKANFTPRPLTYTEYQPRTFPRGAYQRPSAATAKYHSVYKGNS